MDKAALRKEIRQMKKAMTEEELKLRSHRLCEKFLQSEAYRSAKTLYGYLPYNQEVRTWEILQRAFLDGKRVAVPKVYGQEMRFIYITDFSQIDTGYCGIPEPIALTRKRIAAASMHLTRQKTSARRPAK
jgi:5-formyltetrahydrofolate cyclo-ligase